MTDVLLYMVSFTAGAGISLLFMALLWLQVKKLTVARQQAALFLFGMLGRLVLVVGLLFMIFRFLGMWHLFSAVAGFILARTIIIKRWFSNPVTASSDPGEVREAQ